MTYKVIDNYHQCFTSTAPKYSVYRKRRLLGWKYIGNSHSRHGEDVIDKDFAMTPHNDGEWIVVTIAKP